MGKYHGFIDGIRPLSAFSGASPDDNLQGGYNPVQSCSAGTVSSNGIRRDCWSPSRALIDFTAPAKGFSPRLEDTETCRTITTTPELGGISPRDVERVMLHSITPSGTLRKPSCVTSRWRMFSSSVTRPVTRSGTEGPPDLTLKRTRELYEGPTMDRENTRNRSRTTASTPA
jgi:hypothetical protein